jgi:hypothetical protein
MSKRIVALVIVIVLCLLTAIAIGVGVIFTRTTIMVGNSTPVVVVRTPNQTTQSVISVSAATGQPTASAVRTTSPSLASPTTPAPTIAPTPTANPTRLPNAPSNTAPQTLTLSAAQASGMIAERIESAKMPLKNIQVAFNDNQTIVLLGTASVRLPIVGNVNGPIKVTLTPVVRNEKLEANVTAIQFNGIDITEAYKTNVELGVNQAFEGTLGNRRVQQAIIKNQTLVVTVLPQ